MVRAELERSDGCCEMSSNTALCRVDEIHVDRARVAMDEEGFVLGRVKCRWLRRACDTLIRVAQQERPASRATASPTCCQKQTTFPGSGRLIIVPWSRYSIYILSVYKKSALFAARLKINVLKLCHILLVSTCVERSMLKLHIECSRS